MRELNVKFCNNFVVWSEIFLKNVKNIYKQKPQFSISIRPWSVVWVFERFNCNSTSHLQVTYVVVWRQLRENVKNWTTAYQSRKRFFFVDGSQSFKIHGNIFCRGTHFQTNVYFSTLIFFGSTCIINKVLTKCVVSKVKYILRVFLKISKLI